MPAIQDLKVRELVDSDLPFVFSTWLKSYKANSLHTKRQRSSLYYPAYHRLIEKALARSKNLIACLPGDPRTILGYLIAEPKRAISVLIDGLPYSERSIVHMAYTKSGFERFGVMTGLLAHAGIDPNRAVFTHWTGEVLAPGGGQGLITKYPGLVYDPLAFYLDPVEHCSVFTKER